MKALVCGAGGFIGGHLVKRLKDEGYYVVGVDIKVKPDFRDSFADEYLSMDLSFFESWLFLYEQYRDFDEIYQLAADVGGIGYIGTGSNDFNIMKNSSLINIHCATFCKMIGTIKVFFSSSSCVYPKGNLIDPLRIITNENSVYPADCDTNYGWEKLFSERLYMSLSENYSVEVRVARFHNVFGTFDTYDGGREKAPAAICRKISSVKEDTGRIDIWGDGNAVRSYMWIDDCIEGIRRIMNHYFFGIVNLGSDELISINELVRIVALIAKKRIFINYIIDDDYPIGVLAKGSDNRFIMENLGWSPKTPFLQGITEVYRWIERRVREENG